MKFIEINENINQEIKPIYLLTGGDVFLISKTISIFKKKLITEFEELNFDLFDSENYNMRNIINSANGLPFGITQKLVVIKELSKLNKEDELFLQSYCLNPNPSTILLIASNEKVLEKFENVEKIDCSVLSENSLLKLIASECKKNQKTMSVDAGKLLIQKCDSDTSKIVNEVTKLCFYSEENLITAEQVAEVVTDSLELDIFKLTNSLSDKKSDATLQIVKNLLQAKVEPSIIISAISNNFRRMFLASISTDLTNDSLADKLGVKSYAIVKAKENAKKFSVKNLKRINELLTETDYMLKSGQMSAINSVYFLIFNILTIWCLYKNIQQKKY